MFYQSPKNQSDQSNETSFDLVGSLQQTSTYQYLQQMIGQEAKVTIGLSPRLGTSDLSEEAKLINESTEVTLEFSHKNEPIPNWEQTSGRKTRRNQNTAIVTFRASDNRKLRIELYTDSEPREVSIIKGNGKRDIIYSAREHSADAPNYDRASTAIALMRERILDDQGTKSAITDEQISHQNALNELKFPANKDYFTSMSLIPHLYQLSMESNQTSSPAPPNTPAVLEFNRSSTKKGQSLTEKIEQSAEVSITRLAGNEGWVVDFLDRQAARSVYLRFDESLELIEGRVGDSRYSPEDRQIVFSATGSLQTSPEQLGNRSLFIQAAFTKLETLPAFKLSAIDTNSFRIDESNPLSPTPLKVISDSLGNRQDVSASRRIKDYELRLDSSTGLLKFHSIRVRQKNQSSRYDLEMTGGKHKLVLKISGPRITECYKERRGEKVHIDSPEDIRKIFKLVRDALEPQNRSR